MDLKLLLQKAYLKLNFNSKKYWEMRYASEWNSGDGSYGEQAEAKAVVFNKIIEKYKIKDVIEYGCGDGNQLKYYNIENYLGLDVSPTTIKNCADLYDDDPQKEFMYYDPEAFFIENNLFKFQTSISIDVIFHLVEDFIFEGYIRNLFASASKYVVISSSDHNENQGSSIHFKNRKFTAHVKDFCPDWRLEEVFECKGKSGQDFDSFHVYVRNN